MPHNFRYVGRLLQSRPARSAALFLCHSRALDFATKVPASRAGGSGAGEPPHMPDFCARGWSMWAERWKRRSFVTLQSEKPVCRFF